MADVFEDRLEQQPQDACRSKFAKQVDVPAGAAFVGFDGFKKAIDALEPGDVVLLATPPGVPARSTSNTPCRKGVHVFMEKSFAVDAPGVRRVLRPANWPGRRTSRSPAA